MALQELDATRNRISVNPVLPATATLRRVALSINKVRQRCCYYYCSLTRPFFF